MYAIRSYYVQRSFRLYAEQPNHIDGGEHVITSYSIHYTKLYELIRHHRLAVLNASMADLSPESLGVVKEPYAGGGERSNRDLEV